MTEGHSEGGGGGGRVTDGTTSRAADVAEVTVESIRNLLDPTRRRFVLFFHEDDRAAVFDACRTLRSEGYEIAERPHRYMKQGLAVAVDADYLQPDRILGKGGITFDRRWAAS